MKDIGLKIGNVAARNLVVFPVFLFCNFGKYQLPFLSRRKMTSSTAILGSYFVLFLVLTVGAQEVPIESNEVHEGTESTLPTLNITDSRQSGHDASSSLNTTTEERPSKCKEILKSFVDESFNSVSCTIYYFDF